MTTDFLTPTTELEAVNEILATIGEAPLSTLTGALPADAATALRLLRHRSRGLQASGWSFNTDFSYRLGLDSKGEIPLAANILSADAVEDLDVISRGRRLYNRRTHTFKFTKPVLADVIRLLAFDELPEYAREFLVASSARRFQDQLLGDDSLHSFNQRDETLAWANFLNAEAEHGDYNVLRESPSAFRVIRKRGLV